MFLRIESLLTAAEVAALRRIASASKFVDGRISNPANNAKVNQQIDMAEAGAAEAAQIVAAALGRSREFSDFAFPKRMAPPTLSRYEPGMTYGAHADAPYIFVNGVRLRSDVSLTVFLSDPASYEGGELAVQLGGETLLFKGAAGEAIVYPSTLLHAVRPVRAGIRLVAFSFVESLIADEHRRTQLYELNEIAALEGLTMKMDRRVRFEVVRANLLRMWSSE